MASLYKILAPVGVALLWVLCVGIVRRGKIAHCWTFTAYAVAATLFSSYITLFPARYTPELFIVKQGIYDSLLFGMALEIAYKAFSAFQGVASRVRGLLAMSVCVSSVAVFLLVPVNAQYAHIGRFQPSITTAGLWCLTFVALLIVWYQIPVPAFTRAIMLGYVPYLLVFVFCLDLIERMGWGFIDKVGALNAGAYSASAGYLAYAAWRKD